MNSKDKDIVASSGNVFADIGLSNADELLAKANLAHQIASIARHRHLTQTETAKILGTTQPKVSDLFAGKLAGFSMERLIRFLVTLDRDVTLVVAPKPRSKEHASFCVLKTTTVPKAGSTKREFRLVQGGRAQTRECVDDASPAEA